MSQTDSPLSKSTFVPRPCFAVSDKIDLDAGKVVCQLLEGALEISRALRYTCLLYTSSTNYRKIPKV